VKAEGDGPGLDETGAQVQRARSERHPLFLTPNCQPRLLRRVSSHGGRTSVCWPAPVW